MKLFRNIALVVVLSFTVGVSVNANEKYDTDIPIEESGEVKQEVLDIVQEQIEKVPDIVKDRFVEDSWRLIVTDENIAKTEFDGVYLIVNAATVCDDKYIKISNRMTAASTSTIHEFGHFLYKIAGRFDNEEDVKDAYELEKDNKGEALSGGNGLSNHREFYAEVFYLYCVNIEDAISTYPEMVSIIEKDIKSII